MHTRTFALILRLLALAVFLVGALHLALGVRADVLLVKVPAATIADPTLDSQARFHGVSFAVYGVLLLLRLRRQAVRGCRALGFVDSSWPLGLRGYSPQPSTGFRPRPSWVLACYRADCSAGPGLVDVTGCTREHEILRGRLMEEMNGRTMG